MYLYKCSDILLESLTIVSIFNMNQKVCLTHLLLLLITNSVDGLQCLSCQDVVDEALCTATQTCSQGESCYKITHTVNNTTVITEGCLDNKQCGADVSTIIGRDISNIFRRQSPICKECCSTDSCNVDLCRHEKPSVCLDDETIDCPKMNSIFNICNDIHHAKSVCPKFCGLCKVVDGQWSTWSDWTQCVVTCDNGTVSRQRTCSNPAPSGGGLNCTGQSSQVKECFTATPCPVDGNWSEWSHWGSCSTSCEAGIQTRTRTCTNPKPDNQGDHCFGPNVDSRLCDNGPCADGGWTSWSAWSTCTSKCGNGIKTQSRSCTNPLPSPHGQYCVGDPIRVDTCTDFNNCESCSELKYYKFNAHDGIYNITLWKSKRNIQVYCDMTTNDGGWTVFQRRNSGTVDFYRNFTDYVNGFGDLRTEFWLGLDYIQEITSNNPNNQLRIDLSDANLKTAFEVFDNFSLSPGPGYTLLVGNTLTSNNIGSSNRFGPYHNGMSFSTFDHDVDKSSDNCASLQHGAFWYNDCYYANLNGKYLTPGSSDGTGIMYFSFIYYSSLRQTKMSFRRSIP